MKKLLTALSCGIALMACGADDVAAPNEEVPSFEEVQAVIRTNLVGATEDSVNAASVEGLLSALGARAVLLEPGESGANASTAPFVTNALVYRGNIAYLRLVAVANGVAEEVRDALGELASTNELIGLVLDARFANGEDYPAAVAVADLFLDHEVPLMNWGEGLKRSEPKEEAVQLPTALLLNKRTSGSAEALAGALRHAGAAILLGGRTAGAAGVRETFELSSGQQLRIVTSMVQLGDARMLSTEGLVPDVQVEVSLVDEERYLADAFADLSSESYGEGQGSQMQRINEADLVRSWRGEAPMDRQHGGAIDAERTRLVRDPTLVRALDLMDGLAVMRRAEK